MEIKNTFNWYEGEVILTEIDKEYANKLETEYQKIKEF